MNEAQIRETLIAICEVLKAEYKYLGSLQRGQSALFDALKKEIPMIEQRYAESARQAFGQDYPGTAERLEQLDALLARLKGF